MKNGVYSVPVRLTGEGIDWPSWITAVTSAVTLSVLVITAVFALFALRDARRTRHAQLILQLQEQWASAEIQASTEKYAQTGDLKITEMVRLMYDPAERHPTEAEVDSWYTLIAWPNLIETIGVLESEGSMTCDAIYKMWGGGILGAWSAWEDAIPVLREFDGETDTYLYFETIALALLPIRERRSR